MNIIRDFFRAIRCDDTYESSLMDDGAYDDGDYRTMTRSFLNESVLDKKISKKESVDKLDPAKMTREFLTGILSDQ